MKILLFVLAIWTFMHFDPSEEAIIKRNFGNCPKNGHRTLAIECSDWCQIRLARANFRKGGRVTIVGRAGWRAAFTQKKPKCGRKCFCKGVSKKRNAVTCKKHKGKKIRSKYVHFDIRCKRLTKKLRFMVNAINIKPPKVQSTKIGNMAEDDRKFFRIRCDGMCDFNDFQKNLYITFDNNARFLFLCGMNSFEYYENVRCDVTAKKICVASTADPVKKIAACFLRKNLNVNSFSFYVRADENINNMIVHHRISNLLSFEPYTPEKVCNHCTGSQMTGACDMDGDCICNPGYERHGNVCLKKVVGGG